MGHQIPLPSRVLAGDVAADERRRDSTREVAPDVAYKRLGIVNVAFIGRPLTPGWLLVDCGLPGTRGLIKAAAAARFGRDVPPAAILMTHGHFDHVGALPELAEEWGVPVYAHPLEHPYLAGEASYPPGDPSVGGGAMARLSGFYPRGPITLGTRLQALPDDGTVPDAPGWRWVHTPGHSVGHVSFWRPEDRTLIAGDAIVTTAQETLYGAFTQSPEMHGPPTYYTVEWDKARDSVARLAALEPELLVTGHGRAMRGPEMRAALRQLRDEFDTLARPAQGRYLDRPARAEDGTAYAAP